MKVGDVYGGRCPSHADWGSYVFEVVARVGENFVAVMHDRPQGTVHTHVFNADGFEVGPVAYDRAFELVQASKAKPLYTKAPEKPKVSKPKVGKTPGKKRS